MNLSRDGKRVSFLVADNGKNTIFHDFKPVGEWPQGVDIRWPLTLSADGDVLAWRIGPRVYVHGKLQPIEGRGIPLPVLSADGRTVAYTVEEPDSSSVVVNDSKGPAFESILGLAISEDGSTVAYIADDEHGTWLVISGKKVRVEGGMYGVFLSSDGRRVGTVRNGQVVVEGQAGEKFRHVWNPAFSLDGRKFAYFAVREDQQYLVIGGRRHAIEGRAEKFHFSPDGKQVGYVTLLGREIWWKVLDARGTIR